MAWKGKESNGIDYKRLQNTLVNSRVHTDNKALYQLLQQLINGAKDFQEGIDQSFNKETDKLNIEDQIVGRLSAKNGGIESGYYFPDLVDVLNITSHSTYYSHFLITERLVQVVGKINVQPSIANIRTLIEIQVPLPSAFTTADQLHGLVNGVPLSGGIVGFAGIIVGNTGTGYGQIQFYPPSTDNFDIRFSMSYERVPI